MKGRARIVELPLLGGALLLLDATQLRQPGIGRAPDIAQRRPDRRQTGCDVADQFEIGRPVSGQLVRPDVEADQLRPLGNTGAEAEPEVKRHPDHQRHVGTTEPGATGAAEGELVVGRQAPSPQAIEEDRDAELLGKRPQLPLPLHQ